MPKERFRSDITENFFLEKVGKSWNGVPIPGKVPEMHGCGTGGCDLKNLNESMIQWALACTEEQNEILKETKEISNKTEEISNKTKEISKTTKEMWKPTKETLKPLKKNHPETLLGT